MMQLELKGHQHLTNILAMAIIIYVEPNHQVISYLYLKYIKSTNLVAQK